VLTFSVDYLQNLDGVITI